MGVLGRVESVGRYLRKSDRYYMFSLFYDDLSR